MTTTRYIAKCKACNCVSSTLSVGQDARRRKDDPRREGTGSGVYTHERTGDFVIDCRKCCGARRATAVRGTYSTKHECSAKCLASTGPQCECSCGGKNHGASYAA